MKKPLNLKKLIFVYVGVILLIFAGYLIYDNLVFRVKSTDPTFNDGNAPASMAFIKINFSQPLESVGEIKLNEKTFSEQEISLDKKSLTVKIDPITIKLDEYYKLTISDIKSKWPSFPIDQKVFEFTTKYIPANQLTDEQQKAIVELSNSGQIDDPFLSNNFPVYKDEFRIRAENVDGKYILVDVAFYEEIPDYDNGGKISQVSNEKAEELRLKALETIGELDGTASDYKIIYSNKYLNRKYSPPGN